MGMVCDLFTDSNQMFVGQKRSRGGSKLETLVRSDYARVSPWFHGVDHFAWPPSPILPNVSESRRNDAVGRSGLPDGLIANCVGCWGGGWHMTRESEPDHGVDAANPW